MEKEDFSFEILDCPSHWEDVEVKQFISNNLDEEIENLLKFCKNIIEFYIVSGHNILGFDNYHLYGRLNYILANNLDELSDNDRKIFQNFISRYARLDKSFHFGVGSEVVQFYPCSFDTYLAARKFYSFLDEFRLKTLALFLGIKVKDRIYLTPSQIKIDAQTLKYNKQDIQEQIGVTLNLIQQQYSGQRHPAGRRAGAGDANGLPGSQPYRHTIRRSGSCGAGHSQLPVPFGRHRGLRL